MIMDTPNTSTNENNELSGVLGLAVAQAREQRPVASVRGEALRAVTDQLRLKRENSLRARWSRGGLIATISAIAAVVVLVATFPTWNAGSGKTIAISDPVRDPQDR